MAEKNDLVIGLCGLFGAGKGEVTKFFIERGFHYYSLSDELREMLRKQGKEINRDTLREIGNEIRMHYGSGYLAERIRMKMERPAVVDSIRNPGEVEELRKEKQFFLIAVEAPIELRYQRLVSRTRESEEKQTFEEFRTREEMELRGDATAQQNAAVIEMADIHLQNDGTLAELNQQLEVLYTELLKKE